MHRCKHKDWKEIENYLFISLTNLIPQNQNIYGASNFCSDLSPVSPVMGNMNIKHMSLRK